MVGERKIEIEREREKDKKEDMSGRRRGKRQGWEREKQGWEKEKKRERERQGWERKIERERTISRETEVGETERERESH